LDEDSGKREGETGAGYPVGAGPSPSAAVAARLEPLLVGGEIATGRIVDRELLCSARSSKDYLPTLADRRSLQAAFRAPWTYSDPHRQQL
jgi:hypothetical protein